MTTRAVTDTEMLMHELECSMDIDLMTREAVVLCGRCGDELRISRNEMIMSDQNRFEGVIREMIGEHRVNDTCDPNKHPGRQHIVTIDEVELTDENGFGIDFEFNGVQPPDSVRIHSRYEGNEPESIAGMSLVVDEALDANTVMLVDSTGPNMTDNAADSLREFGQAMSNLGITADEAAQAFAALARLGTREVASLVGEIEEKVEENRIERPTIRKVRFRKK